VSTAGCQVPSVIVDDHREHARSYRSVATDQGFGKSRSSVGASMRSGKEFDMVKLFSENISRKL